MKDLVGDAHFFEESVTVRAWRTVAPRSWPSSATVVVSVVACAEVGMGCTGSGGSGCGLLALQLGRLACCPPSQRRGRRFGAAAAACRRHRAGTPSYACVVVTSLCSDGGVVGVVAGSAVAHGCWFFCMGGTVAFGALWGSTLLSLACDVRVQPEKIRKLLDNVASGSGMASVMEKTEGMKYILAVRGTAALFARVQFCRRVGIGTAPLASPVPAVFPWPATTRP